MENENKYCYKYPHPSVTADCVIFTFHDGQLKVLLVKRGVEPYKGEWALPGGFMRIDESAEDCARRELREETGFDATHITQFHTFSRPDRDPRERVVTVAFYALVRWQSVAGADDADEAIWQPTDTLPKLAFDHAEILAMALKSLRREIYFHPVGFELLDKEFPMSELQKVYEAILGREFDRRNFAKKMQHTEVIVPADYSPEPQTLECCQEPTEPQGLKKKSIFDLFSSSPSHACKMAPQQPVEQPDMATECNAAEMPAPKRRKSRLFRFNSRKYDELKDADDFEF